MAADIRTADIGCFFISKFLFGGEKGDRRFIFPKWEGNAAPSLNKNFL